FLGRIRSREIPRSVRHRDRDDAGASRRRQNVIGRFGFAVPERLAISFYRRSSQDVRWHAATDAALYRRLAPPRVGKTLFARLLIEFLRTGGRPLVGYDLDPREPALAGCFPDLVWPIDIADTRGCRSLAHHGDRSRPGTVRSLLQGHGGDRLRRRSAAEIH